MIIVDSREPDKLKNLASYTRELPIDYIILGEHKKYMIERKEVNDFWSSVIDGRLWSQLEYLSNSKAEGYTPILCIVGEWWRVFKIRKVRITQWFGAMAGVAGFGVATVWLKTESDFASFIKHLERKAGEAQKNRSVAIPKPKDRTLEDEAVDVLAAISGIGHATARKILGDMTLGEFFASPHSKMVEYLGERKAEHVAALLKTKLLGT